VEIQTLIAWEMSAMRFLAEQSEKEGKILLGGGYWRLLDYLLKHGQPFKGQALPRRYVRRAPKACFYNSWQLARRSTRLRYVEGRAMGSDFGFAFDHAWTTDRYGYVVDPTLRDPATYQYYGIIFEQSELPLKYNVCQTPLQKLVTEKINAQR
jgi:hypothetical protein